MVVGESLMEGVPPDRPAQDGPRLPDGLRRCRRVVAVTVHLPEFLLATGGLMQRLGAERVPTDVLVAGDCEPADDHAAAMALDRLGVTGLARHRLALPTPIGPDRGDDLLAALSELVGFDPEVGVYCLAPSADGGICPDREALAAAADRICRVYRLPLLSYPAARDASTTDLELDSAEWARKCDALDACATQVTPLSGRAEYFSLSPAPTAP